MYEYNDWILVMVLGIGGVVYLNVEDGVLFDGLVNQLQDIGFIYGLQGVICFDFVLLLVWEMLGMDVELVFGIKGCGDGCLMFECGEVNIDYQIILGYLGGLMVLVDVGDVVVMMLWGVLDVDGNIVCDLIFFDMLIFKEVCEVIDGCEIEGDVWDVWKVFFVVGFLVQKLVFLLQGIFDEYVDVYLVVFEVVVNCLDFVEILVVCVGEYEVFIGVVISGVLVIVIVVLDSVKEFVLIWFKDVYGVELN